MTGDPAAVGAYLRARRAAREPRAAGLPGGGTRRAPGLRREEVAALAGLSVDYLTRLEQGRHRDPSPEVLAALASALGLDAAGRRHLFALAGRTAPEIADPARRTIPPGAARLVDRAAPSPAWLLNRVKDVVRRNAPAVELLGAAESYLDLVFRPPVPWVEPDVVRADVVAHLRRTTAPVTGSPEVAAALRDSARRLDGFAELWHRHDVAAVCRPTRMLDHPLAGRLTFLSELLEVEGGDLHLVVLEPADEQTRTAWTAHLATAPPHLRAV